MPDLDEFLKNELRRTVRPVDINDVSSRIDLRRTRRARLRKIQAAALTLVVIAGTLGGFAALSIVFREPGPGVAATSDVRNGGIVYSEVRNAGQHLWVVNPDGTGARQLTTDQGVSDSDPAISPDGRTVAFVRTGAGGSSICLIGIDGMGLAEFSTGDVSAVAPAWSPDGGQIAFASEAGGIFVASVDGSKPRLLGDSRIDVATALAWSPDSTKIAFSAPSEATGAQRNYDLWITDVDGVGQVNITYTTDASELSPAWSPDGSQILLSRSTPSGASLMLMAPDPDAVPVEVTDGASLDQNPSWAPDGSLIVFDRTWAGGTDVYTSRPDGTDLTLVVRNATDPVWQRVPPKTPALSTIALPGGLSAMRLAIGERAVWALGSKDHGVPSSLLRIDPVTDQVVATIPLEGEPWYLVSGGGTVWIGSPRSSVLQRVDAATNDVMAPIQLPGNGVKAIAANDEAVWVEVTDRSNQGQQDRVSLVRIDAQTSTVVATIPLQGLTGYDDEVAIGGAAVWVAGVNLTSPSEERGADLVRIDPSTNEIAAVIPVSAFSVRAGANAIWVTSPADGVNDSLRKPESWVAYQIDSSTNAISTPVALPEGLSGVLAITDSGVWFAGYDGQRLIHPMRLEGGAFDSSVPPINSVYSDMVVDEATGTIWVAAIIGLERIDLG
jgi:hypothetical protein